jgi:hypothetical protein
MLQTILASEMRSIMKIRNYISRLRLISRFLLIQMCFQNYILHTKIHHHRNNNYIMFP